MRTVIITGANGNLGSAVTAEFLNKGYQVIATVHHQNAVSEFNAHDRLHTRVVNLSNEEETSSFVHSAIEEFGTIYGAMLLVGGFAMGSLKDSSVGDIRKQISLNFDTAYHVAQPLLTHMKENGSGRLVFIGSRPALLASAGKEMVGYALSKSLLFKLAEFINHDAKGTNITATVVVPSTLDTPANRKHMPDADPAKWVTPSSVAEILEFVMSEKSSSLRETILKVYNNS
jgi:NAD(P)-dependent dehydrogenase (short-subunit alcohol dehydrogenase family)